MKRETTLHVVKPEEAATSTPVPGKLQRFLDPNWKYTRGDSTDIRKTFQRVRREQAKPAKPKGKK